jgi:hypothetical protein
VNNCNPGSPTLTDVIVLTPGVTYSGWGALLHVPPGGGPLTIQGGVDANGNVTTLVAANKGFPNPIGGASACGSPAAIFVGGTLTILQVQLVPSDPFTTGICQYAGTLNVLGSGISNFSAGGILSNSSNNAHRALNISSGSINGGKSFISAIEMNSTPGSGGGIMLVGNVTTAITNAAIEDNAADGSGGALSWQGGFGTMGSLKITGAIVDNNSSARDSGNGGAFDLEPDDVNATVTITGGFWEDNAVQRPEFSVAGFGGAMYIGPGFGANKLILNGVFIDGSNVVWGWPSDPFPQDVQQFNFNSDSWVYNAISCRGTSKIARVVGSEWNGHSPQLKGDGTCQLSP